MGLGNNPGDNQPKDDGRKNDKGEGHDKQPTDSGQPSSFEGVTLPSFGEKVGEGHYVVSVGGDVVAAGNADLYEKGFVGERVFDGDTLKMYGITDEEGAFRALKGDNGSSKTSVGYNPGYAKGWDRLFGAGPSNN